MSDRVSQYTPEVLVSDTTLRVSQYTSEVLVSDTALRVSQFISAALCTDTPIRASQYVLEAVVTDTTAGPIRVSQFVAEVVTISYEVLMPATYPTLIGLAYSVIKRPIFNNAIGTGASLAEVRVAYTDAPIWEWDLIYEYLPDKQANGSTPSDLKTLMGFYLSTTGNLTGFLFKDPDDHTVTGQIIGTTDGTAFIYTLIRTYGGSDGTGTEQIGYVDTGATFNVYLDSVLQDPSSYDIVTTTPVDQLLRFHSVPTAGQVITVDMTYFYYVRFKDPKYDFEKFVDLIWRQGKLTLRSLRQ